MAWKLDMDRPIYAQLVDILSMQIISGKYGPGDGLPTVRDLAQEAAVNPNTMQKAFAELERIGLVQTHRTKGRTVTLDGERIADMREDMAEKCFETFISGMKALGYKEEDILSLLGERLGRREAQAAL